MRERPRVAVFVERYLEPEQTFIFRQMSALSETDVRFVARHPVPGHVYPVENVAFFGGRSALPGRWAWRWERLRRAVTRRYAVLGRQESGRLRRLLAALRPDLVHAHWGPDAMLVAPLCRALGLPLLVHFHGYDASRLAQDAVYRASLRPLFAQMAVALTVSEHMRERVIGLGGPPAKARCHYTGVPEEFFGVEPRAPSPGGRWVLLQVGRLAEVKGHRDALDALAAAARRNPRLVLRVAGDGPLRRPLEEQAASLGLGDSVEFLGRLTSAEVVRELRQAHALLMPSRTAGDGGVEGLPNAVVEALAAGLPVVGTRHGGIPEAVRYESEPEWLVPEADPEALAHRVGRLISEPGLWSRLSAEGRQRARERFHLPTQSLKLQELYRALSSRARGEDA